MALPGRWVVLGEASACQRWFAKRANLASSISDLQGPEELLDALENVNAGGVIFERKERFDAKGNLEPGWLREMRAVDVVPGFVSARVSSDCVAYTKAERWDALGERELAALEKVMRGIFRGETPPQLSSFPGAMRQKREVELLVLLRLGGELRMWRSARRSSVASAALTVASAIRDRWRSRRAFMQEDLADVAETIDIEIWRMEDEGTVLVESLAEVEGLLPPRFGIGVEHQNGWSYRLPELVQREPVAITEKLLEEDEIDPLDLGIGAPRLYRFRLASLGER